MAGRVFSVPRGTFTPDGLCGLTDAEFASKVDTSPAIGAAYARLGRIGNPMGRAIETARVFGRGNAPSTIGGTPRGEAPAGGECAKGWRDVGIVKPRRQPERPWHLKLGGR